MPQYSGGMEIKMNELTLGRRIYVCINTLLLLAFSFVCLYPVLYVIFASFSNADLLMSHKGVLWAPLDANLAAYRSIAKNRMIFTGYMNTIFIVLASVVLSIVMTSIGAYFLSRKNLRFKKAIMIYIMLTMYFSGGIIPFFLTVKNLGMYNSYLALIIPTAINTYNLVIMRTAFEAVPDSLVEAASIDGAGNISILFRIVLPLTKATIAVMVLYYGVANWNSWFNAMLFMKDRVKYPLQLVLREILIQNDTTAMTQGGGLTDSINISKTIKYAVIVVSTVPILCVYPFLQKYFAQGTLVGAVKG